MSFQFPNLPPKSAVGILDPEIAGEGMKVILDSGEQADFMPSLPAPNVPDYSAIKSIAHYFRPRPHRAYPAWLYHPTEKPRLVKGPQEAAELGVRHRPATFEEKGRFGGSFVWDWADDSQWRPSPYPDTLKFDPNNPDQGKTVIHNRPSPLVEQAQLVSAVVTSVMSIMEKQGATAAPGGGGGAPAVDPGEWAEFQRFRAWQAAQTVVAAAQAEAEQNEELPDDAGNSDATPPSDTREPQSALSATWPGVDLEDLGYNEMIRLARRHNVKVDGRWSEERLRAELLEAMTRPAA